MATILRPPISPRARVTDALGREWARKTNGTWACLGHALTVESFDDLHATYIVTGVSG